MRRVRALTAALFSCLLGNIAAAETGVEDALGGFDEAVSDIPAATAPQEAAATSRKVLGWTVNGSLSAAISYNLTDHDSSAGTEYDGLSKLRLRGNLDLERKLAEDWRAVFNMYAWRDLAYDIHDRSYTNEVLDEYQDDLDIQDAFVEGKLSDRWDLKAGRQVAVWGFADNLRVLDTLNPLDNLEPGIADIEDLRRPVGMLRMNYYRGPWQIGLYAIPEQRFSRNPPFGSDFYALTDANGNAVQFREEKPDDFESISYALSAKARFSGWDMTLNAARVWNDEPYLDPTAFDINAPGTRAGTFYDAAVLRHSRLNLLGFGLQMTRGSWLFKQEYAALDKLWLTETGPVMVIGGIPILGGLPLPLPIPLPGGGATVILPNGIRGHAQHSLLLGVEYFGWVDTNIGVEIAARHLDDFSPNLAASGYFEDRMESSLRITRSFLNERLRATFVAVLFATEARLFGDDGGALYRFNADYELARNLELTGGMMIYEDGRQQPFTAIDDNDRLFGEIKWSF